MMASSSQAKLLRFLQDREFRPLGSTRIATADVRIIAASNASLPDLVAQRFFREDLYHRLNVLPLTIPPLRERTADIPLLANHFAARFAMQYSRALIQFAPEALKKMMVYQWPGNVRELESVVHRAIVFSSSSTLAAAALEIASIATLPPDGSRGSGKDDAMLGFERGYLVNLLADHQGNLSRCATASGKDRRTLQRLLRKHGLERLSFRNAG
jgi:DNA-binding NtrC family response regulator